MHKAHAPAHQRLADRIISHIPVAVSAGNRRPSTFFRVGIVRVADSDLLQAFAAAVAVRPPSHHQRAPWCPCGLAFSNTPFYGRSTGRGRGNGRCSLQAAEALQRAQEDSDRRSGPVPEPFTRGPPGG